MATFGRFKWTSNLVFSCVLGSSLLACSNTPNAAGVSERDDAQPISPAANGDAASSITKADEANCHFRAGDAYETKTRIPSGPHKGECYDTRIARPVFIVSEGEPSSPENPASRTLVVANVTHGDEYYLAHIPLSGIRRAIFQLEHFPAQVPAGHTELRIQFNEDQPVKLVPQVEGRGAPATIHDLIISIEALGQPGYHYALEKGIGIPNIPFLGQQRQSEFGAVLRLTSLSHKYFYMVTKQKNKVEQFLLDIDPKTVETILVNYLHRSQKEDLNSMYDTIRFNCTTELFTTLDSGIQYSWVRQIAKLGVKLTDFYPNAIRASLLARGLLNGDYQLPDLNEEKSPN